MNIELSGPATARFIDRKESVKSSLEQDSGRRTRANMWSYVILAVFQILLYYCDFLRHITKYYDILRHITTYYDILRHLRQNTTYYDILRQITCFTVEKHFLSKISSFKRIYSQICRHMSFWPFFRFCCITAIFYDILRNITTYYDI